MPTPIIATTGTKGKTTVTYVISEALRKLHYNVLRVDTTGHYVNGVQKSSLDDSKNTWRLVPTVSPGRYMYEFLLDPSLRENGVAVLETALGSSRQAGLGYRVHEVGIFLNVFEDHLGSSPRLQTRSDIAVAKEFVFERLGRDGVAVFNADDDLVVRSLRKVPADINVTLLPFGMKFSAFDIETHLKNGGKAITVKASKVVLLSKSDETELVDLQQIPWAFNGAFQPSIWNTMAAAGGLYAFHGCIWSKKLQESLQAVRLDPHAGRLTLLKAANGATILADYAHEKVSLAEVAKLGRSLLKPGGQLIGVVRLAHDRTDSLMRETGNVVGQAYDSLIVFDKIDGELRKPKVGRSTTFPEIVGRTSELFAAGIKEKNSHVERILREDKALARAAELAGPKDVVIAIVNDDITQSLQFIKSAFKAEYL